MYTFYIIYCTGIDNRDTVKYKYNSTNSIDFFSAIASENDAETSYYADLFSPPFVSGEYDLFS